MQLSLIEPYFSPVIIFAYKRPFHTKQILSSLAENKESKQTVLYIICDGPKENATVEDHKKVQEVITIAQAEQRFKEVRIIIQTTNKGLATSVMDGVKLVLSFFETVIVLEDDLILSPYFLYYMNDSLVRYQHFDKVAQIGACNFFACGSKYPQTFFLPIPDCLGWATWKNRWEHFTGDAAYLLEEIKKNKVEHKFNAYGSYDMMKMLEAQANGSGTSWAVRWTATCILNGWLTLYPNPSMTNHIESQEATNANINITPPLSVLMPELNTVEVIELPNVIKAMKRGLKGIGDYYGNIRSDKKGYLFRKYIGFYYGKKILRIIYTKFK